MLCWAGLGGWWMLHWGVSLDDENMQCEQSISNMHRTIDRTQTDEDRLRRWFNPTCWTLCHCVGNTSSDFLNTRFYSICISTPGDSRFNIHPGSHSVFDSFVFGIFNVYPHLSEISVKETCFSEGWKEGGGVGLAVPPAVINCFAHPHFLYLILVITCDTSPVSITDQMASDSRRSQTTLLFITLKSKGSKHLQNCFIFMSSRWKHQQSNAHQVYFLGYAVAGVSKKAHDFHAEIRPAFSMTATKYAQVHSEGSSWVSPVFDSWLFNWSNEKNLFLELGSRRWSVNFKTNPRWELSALCNKPIMC